MKANRNYNFDRYVATAKNAARQKGLDWNVKCDSDGWVDRAHVWDLDRLLDVPQSRKGRIYDLGADRTATHLINEGRIVVGLSPYVDHALTEDWVDLLKSVTIHWVLIQKNRPSTVYDGRLRPLRVLAACARDVPPWSVNVEHLRTALDLADRMGSSLRVVLETVVSRVLDLEHIVDGAPLLALALGGRARAQHKAGRIHAPSGNGLRARLEDRKAAEKLPEMRAFWELVRIAFTEEPRTFLDAVRFDHMKVLICTGFRIFETCIIPADWRRERTYHDPAGRLADRVGGISRSIGIRHFAEKQRGANDDGQILYESVQHVPQIFEPIIEGAFERIIKRTQPLRLRLQSQTETGRLFPEYALDDLVPAGQFYPRLSGDLRLIDDELPPELTKAYRETYDPRILDALWATQQRNVHRLRKYAVNYFHQFGAKAAKAHGVLFPARRSDGSRWNGPIYWVDAYVRVAELEAAVRQAMPRKLPDVTPYKLSGGRLLYPHEMMLLTPKAALTEERNNNILDVNRYFAIGTIDDDDVRRSLGQKEMSLFSRYGRNPDDRSLSLTRTHAIRHLQNTELFRLGLADTIITKRFDRRSVAQSYVYDHRTLAEELDAMDLPSRASEALPEHAQNTYKLILKKRVKGPLVREFERVQEVHGEDAALDYLAAEADGFHATPYGYCVNSFTVDPCPKHLECFNGCRHLALSDIQEHQHNLQIIEKQLVKAVSAIELRPLQSIGRTNQLDDAKRKLANVRVALTRSPGSSAFPDGQDLSVPAGMPKKPTVLDGT